MAALATSAPILWQPNPGPQTRFLASGCYELMYGGQAGGGKSDGLLAGPLRFATNPYFRGIIFRRTFPELEKSLIERSHRLYPAVFPGAHYNEQKHTWSFPDAFGRPLRGGKIYFAHLEHAKTVHQHQGPEYQYIAFDELTSFLKRQYVYMLSRARSAHGIPIMIRSATNPGNTGHEWVFERWRAWLDPKYPHPANDGEVRYFVIPDGQEREIEVPKGTPGATGRTFIKATLEDNPKLLENDPGYVDRLNALDPVTRDQLKKGNWLAKPGRGKYFNRKWVGVLTERPNDIVSTVRHWDWAATESKQDKDDPDWTVGVKLSLRANGRLLVEHCDRFREDPAGVEERYVQTSNADGTDVVVSIEQEGGASGKSWANHLTRLLPRHTVVVQSPTGDKVVRFGPFSAACKNGNVDVLAGDWVQEYFAELEAFNEGAHDDQVDGTSGAHKALTEDTNPMLDALRKLVRQRNAQG